MAELKLLADYNISAELNKIAKMIQLLDPEGKRGERSILLSKHCHSLEGFNLNRNVIFDGVVRRPLSSSISREALSAILELPEMNPGLDFYIPGRLPLFSITAVLGVVPDMVHTPFDTALPNRKPGLLRFQNQLNGLLPLSASLPKACSSACQRISVWTTAAA